MISALRALTSKNTKKTKFFVSFAPLDVERRKEIRCIRVIRGRKSLAMTGSGAFLSFWRSVFPMHELLHPNHPHNEDDEIEEELENVVVGHLETARKMQHAQEDAANTHHVSQFNNHQAGGDEPSLVPPWAGKQQHKENPVAPLFQA